MNTCISAPSDTKKRVFSVYQGSSSMTQEDQTDTHHLDSSSVVSEDRDTKRTRMHSPVSESPKETVPCGADDSSLPYLPIVKDAVLPDAKESKLDPDEFLLELVKAQYGVSLKPQNGLDLGEEYFKPITDEQHAAYTMEVLTPARDNNVEALKELVNEKGKQVVDCVNRFGESLLNLVCRRGFTESAEYLLSEDIGLDVRSKDDFGRTAMHDAMWFPTPQLEVCGWLIQRDPSLLLVTDKRGNTPFQYARSEDFATWRQFLFDNRASLKGLTEPTTLKRFC